MARYGSKAAFGNDPFFGKPFVDTDEWVDEPRPHRFVHGGFEGTETLFSFYFPPAEEYGGRFLQMFMGGTGGIDRSIAGGPGGLLGGRMSGGLDLYFDFGAYALESNQGHQEPTGVVYELPGLRGQGSILSYRANAEVARFAAALATEMYGAEPHHGYAFGGSAGAIRSIKAIEYAPDLYDGVAPFMTSPPIVAQTLSVRVNAARAIRHQRDAVLDALEVGGSGDPFATLTASQRQALTDAWEMGYPKDAMWLSNTGVGAILHSIIGERKGAEEYVAAFWNEPGYGGADGELDHDLVDLDARVLDVLTAGDVLDSPGADPVGLRNMLAMVPKEMVVAFRVDASIAHALFASERIRESAGAGREFRSMGCVGDAVVCLDPTNPLQGLQVGDEVHIDNRQHLAYCHFHRHHVDPRFPEFKQPMTERGPTYPQRPWVERVMDPMYFNEPHYLARFAGKMILHQHMLDATPCWPKTGGYYASMVHALMGERADDHFRLWLVENCHHIPASLVEPLDGRASTTRIIDYMGGVEQAIHHVIDWVENGVEPPESTPYREHDGQITLPSSAAARKGIQPFVTASANGGVRAEVAVGEEVTFAMTAEMPPNAGYLVSAHVDFDGSGAYPESAPDPDEHAVRMQWTVRHTFDAPGTYFPAFRVRSHRDGRRDVPSRSVENLGRVRVVVRSL